MITVSTRLSRQSWKMATNLQSLTAKTSSEVPKHFQQLSPLIADSAIKRTTLMGMNEMMKRDINKQYLGLSAVGDLEIAL
jgi:hypothetical protein